MAVIRALYAPDRTLIFEHLLRLDPMARRERFHALVSDEAIRRYVHEAPWIGAQRIGWIEAGRLRALVEMLPAGKQPFEGKMELAATVERPWQGRGIGFDLCHRALLHARNRRVVEVTMICVTENHRMQAIARRLAARLIADYGEVEGLVRLPPANLLSLYQEGLCSAGAVLSGVADQWMSSKVREALPLRH
jgi:RimJ/RimL family protein N-acetyltransferase